MLDNDENIRKQIDKSLRLPRRKVLIDIIKNLSDCKSFFEIGCAKGTNLILIKSNFPNTYVSGCDVSKTLISQGNRYDKNLNLKKISFKNLNKFKSIPKADFVFSMDSLYLCDHNQIQETLKEMVKLSKKYIYIQEQQCRDKNIKSDGKNLIHDYESIIKKLGNYELKKFDFPKFAESIQEPFYHSSFLFTLKD